MAAGITSKWAALCAAVVLGTAAPSVTVAHQTGHDPFPHVHGGQQRVVTGESYVPTIWIDPDGCEHWVMDDGWEGYMTLKVDRKGKPTCHKGAVCGVMHTDHWFATASHAITHAGKAHLMQFFQSTGAAGYTIVGHTDSRGSDSYNMRLSQRRAHAVANIAHAAGVRVLDVRGYGERAPIAPNNSAANMAQNRRVEILCAR
ncbi:MAG: OmpA family protein [Shimia sp.]